MIEKKILCPHCGSDNIFSQGNKYLCGDCKQEFVLQEEFQPLNLFISYGHPEDEICTRIHDALTTRGHKVWFDQTHINSGENWRREIADGIANSNGVIACLSKHSVRNPGVCLDELSIAVGVRGGNIKTILLEAESEVQPPASVCHIQWLDMHDWKERIAQGDDSFQPWFDGKMQELFRIVESKESRTFAGQITYIKEKLPACMQHDVSKQSYLLGQLFVGREWLTEEIEQWLDDKNANRLGILYGDAGVGKSAFAAQYIHRNGRVAAGIFCEYDRENFNRPESIIQTLAYLLACRLPDYRVVLVGILSDTENISSLNTSELFDLLLANPLSSMSIDGGHETMCIVIDGLDECGQTEYNALADTLSKYVPRLPRWLRVLVTAREVASVKGPLEQAYRMELHGESRDNLDDVRAYFVHRLAEKFSQEDGWEKALDTLTVRSGGIFLYAELISDGILKGNLSISDPDAFPEGLSAAFHRWFGWICPNDKDGEKYKATLRRPLGAILAAPRPLPADELKRLFGWDDNELHDFMICTEVLLRRGTDAFGKETLEFSHKYISEWLTDANAAGCYYSSRQTATEYMAKRFYEQFQQIGRAHV